MSSPFSLAYTCACAYAYSSLCLRANENQALENKCTNPRLADKESRWTSDLNIRDVSIFLRGTLMPVSKIVAWAPVVYNSAL